MSDRRSADRGSLTGSGAFEKRGGYSPSGSPVSKLPKVPAGPAPGASATSSKGAPAGTKKSA